MSAKNAISISLKLFIITAVAALCLAYVNKITAPIIEENAQKTKVEALKKVLPDATEFSEPEESALKENGAEIEEIYVGKDENGIVGYVVTAVSHEGYGGDIKVMVGIDNDMKVTKIEILESSETAGLGANASEPEFAGQFEGKNGGMTVVKGAAADGQISAISSATVTSKAVTNCVNLAVKAAKEKAAAPVENAPEQNDAVAENEAEDTTEEAVTDGAEETAANGETDASVDETENNQEQEGE